MRGEVTVVPAGGDPGYFTPGARLTTDREVGLVVTASRPYRDRGLVVAFAGISDRNAAEGLRGSILLSTERRPAGPGEWRPEDLIGTAAVDSDGALLGQVTGVVLGAAQDRLVVTTPGGAEVEVPFVDELVDDPADGKIVMRPPIGLFP